MQAGNQPINYSGSAWLDLEDVGSYAKPAGVTTFTPSCVLGAFGRLWVGNIGENRDVVYYSDLLIGHKFHGGSSGSIDLKGVWAGDEIVSINSFMGNYEDAENEAVQCEVCNDDAEMRSFWNEVCSSPNRDLLSAIESPQQRNIHSRGMKPSRLQMLGC